MTIVSKIIARFRQPVYSGLLDEANAEIDLRWGPHVLVGNADLRVGTYRTTSGYMAVVYDYSASIIIDTEGPFIFREIAYDVAMNIMSEWLPDDSLLGYRHGDERGTIQAMRERLVSDEAELAVRALAT